ncbi:MAG: hypothetical protein V2A56_13765, partial [bacterium]
MSALLSTAASGCGAKVSPKEEFAVAKIRKLGGQITFDDKRPEKSVIRVDVNNCKMSDTDLKELTTLTNLQTLFLGGTDVSDAGLEYLKGLNNLQSLALDD